MFFLSDEYPEAISRNRGFHVLENGEIETILNNISKVVIKNYVGKNVFPKSIMDRLSLEIFEGLNIEFFEQNAKIEVKTKSPHHVFNELNILAVDGSSIVFKGHPVRIIIARSGVFSHSQRLTNVIRLIGPYRSVFRIVDDYEGYVDIEDALRKYESETLAFVESQTIIDISEMLNVGEIDFIFHDGPLYFPNGFEYTYEMANYLYKTGTPLISVVKNSYSRTIMQKLGLKGFLDSDFFAYNLKPGTRSPFFLNENPNYEIDNYDLKPVSCYFMTPAGSLLRIDVPYWVFEDYGAEKIVEIVAADVYLGSGKHSYFLKMADKKAKFSDYEKKKLLRELESLIFRAGYNEGSFYNHKRWGFLK